MRNKFPFLILALGLGIIFLFLFQQEESSVPKGGPDSSSITPGVFAADALAKENLPAPHVGLARSFSSLNDDATEAESIFLISASGLAISRIEVRSSNGMVRRESLGANGEVLQAKFQEGDWIEAPGHLPFPFVAGQARFLLEPAFELRLHGLPKSIQNDPSRIRVSAFHGYLEEEEWIVDSGLVEGVWVFLTENPGETFPEVYWSARIQLQDTQAEHVLDLSYAGFDGSLAELSWQQITGHQSAFTAQELRVEMDSVDHEGGLKWQVFLTAHADNPPFNPLLAKGDWGQISLQQKQGWQETTAGASLFLSRIPLGMYLAALVECEDGHFHWFPAAAVDGAPRVGQLSLRPQLTGVIERQGGWLGDDHGILFSMGWDSEGIDRRGMFAHTPLALNQDGSFLLPIELDPVSLMSWDLQGVRPEEVTLVLKGPKTESILLRKPMDWHGSTDFGSMTLHTENPFLELAFVDNPPAIGDHIFPMTGQEEFSRELKDIRRRTITGLAKQGDSWQVFVKNSTPMLPDVKFLRCRSSTPPYATQYFESVGGNRFQPIAMVEYQLVFAPSFWERTKVGQIALQFGGSYFEGVEIPHDGLKDDHPFVFLAPERGMQIVYRSAHSEESWEGEALQPGRNRIH